MTRAALSRAAPRTGSGAQAAVLLAGFSLVAMLFAALGVLTGWLMQVFLLSLLLPLVLVVSDYRLGLILLTVLMPFASSPILPKAGPLSAINLLLVGVCGMFLLRMVLNRMLHKPLSLPMPRELLLYYIVPVTLSCVIGSFYLGEIPPHYFLVNKFDSFGPREYWVSQYLKNMLLVLTACIVGAAVVERGGHGLRFASAVVASAVVFVLAMLALIAVSGVSLGFLAEARSFLGALGRHNNEAGVMLTTALGPILFMMGTTRHRGARFVLGASALLVIGGIVLTFSRGAFLGLLVILLAYVLHFRRLKTAFAVMTLAVVAAAFAPSEVYERLGRGLGEGSVQRMSAEGDELTAGRVYTWSRLSGEVLRSPLWGRGQLSTQWSDHVKNSLYNASHPHNLYLEILMDMGILGAVAMFLFYRFVWRMFRTLSRDPRVPDAMRGFFLGAWAGMLSMFIYGVTNGHYYPAPEQIYFWMAVGLALGYVKWLRTQPEVTPLTPVAPRPGRFTLPPDRILLPGGRTA